MFIGVRILNGKEIEFFRVKKLKVANILADCARYRRPHWVIKVINEDEITRPFSKEARN